MTLYVEGDMGTGGGPGRKYTDWNWASVCVDVAGGQASVTWWQRFWKTRDLLWVSRWLEMARVMIRWIRVDPRVPRRQWW